jgi:hypothetical protein
MKAKFRTMLAFVGTVACSHAPPPAHSGKAGPAARLERSRAATETPPLPPLALMETDALPEAPLGATRTAAFELDRQVTELRRAKLLYEQFVERAAGKPELEPALKKSRERIVDVQKTIDFLLGAQLPSDDPAPSP